MGRCRRKFRNVINDQSIKERLKKKYFVLKQSQTSFAYIIYAVNFYV